MTDTGGKPYAIVGPVVHDNVYNRELGVVEPGSTITAKWNASGDIIRVFVPDGADLVSTADSMIRFQGAQLDALRAL